MNKLWEKSVGALLYMIPWYYCLPFGYHLFRKYPLLEIVKIPTIPIELIQRSLPFGGLLLFLAIFLGLVRNQKIGYFLRFNALQSLLINIGIIIITYLFEIFLNSFNNTLMVRTFSTTLLMSVFAIITYCIYCCFKGNEPNLPVISEATKMQL